MPDEKVTWEMVCRFRPDEHLWLELRALSRTEVEVLVQVPGARRSLTATFAELRALLDELERSAKEVEKL